ncbi:MAG: hypothetical protein ACXVAY_00680 [Mucilaginibacter sp.]
MKVDIWQEQANIPAYQAGTQRLNEVKDTFNNVLGADTMHFGASIHGIIK